MIASTRAAAGVYEDRCGPIIVDWLNEQRITTPAPVVVPDGSGVVNALLADNISVYSIAVQSAYLERKISPIDRNRSPLIRYADHSGGETYHAAKEHSFEEFYRLLTEQARYQYTLAYVPRGTDRSSDYHTIEVRVKREGLNIKTREGYYTGATPTAKSQ